MDDETKMALEESIAKWRQNSLAETTDQIVVGISNCPLCRIFYDVIRCCYECPVERRTRVGFCEDTPYYEVERMIQFSMNEPVTPDIRDAVLREVAFLESLLPQDDEK